MTFFFFVFGLEARREFDMGELRGRARLALPVAAGAAGVRGRHARPRRVTAAAGAGFCGTLATFSTFGYETIRMAEDGNRLAAASIIIALGAAYCGMVLAHAITA